MEGRHPQRLMSSVSPDKLLSNGSIKAGAQRFIIHKQHYFTLQGLATNPHDQRYALVRQNLEEQQAFMYTVGLDLIHECLLVTLRQFVLAIAVKQKINSYFMRASCIRRIGIMAGIILKQTYAEDDQRLRTLQTVQPSQDTQLRKIAGRLTWEIGRKMRCVMSPPDDRLASGRHR